MRRDSVLHWEVSCRRKRNREYGEKKEMSRKAQKSGFMENFERFGHEPDKEDEGEEVKGFSVFFLEN